MKRTLTSILGLGSVLLACSLFADQSADTVKAKVAKALGIDSSEIHTSEASGLLEVRHGHDFVYVTADGKYLLKGDLINIDTGVQVTELRRRAERLAALKELGDENMIEFGPRPPIAPKYVVTVFTDIDCPYCRKLHSEIADYNAKGIAIRYAFFPRTGLNTPSYYKAVSVWCSNERSTAFTRAKHGDNVPEKRCENPVEREYRLGLELGIQGTPMLILPNGDIYPGYLTADELATVLSKEEDDTKSAAVPQKPDT